MAAMKRPAASTAGGAAKKPATSAAALKKPAAALAKKQCAQVCAALAAASDFPKPVLAMLKDALPACLPVPKEDRHEFQGELIKMAGQVLESLLSGAQSKVDAAEKALSDLTGEEAKRLSDLTEASDVTASKKKALEDAQAAVKESASAQTGRKADLASAEEEQKAGDVELEAAAEKQGRLESVIADLFTPMREGTVETNQARVKAFVKRVKEFDIEDSLLSSLQSTLLKAVGTRGSFDTMVLEQGAAAFDECKDALVKILDNGEPGKKERADKVAAAAARLVEAAEAVQSCKAAVAAAQAELKEAQAVQKAADSAYRQFGPDIKRLTANLQDAKDGLQGLLDGPKKAFEELLEFTAIEPPAEEAAAEAADPAPAEEAAEEVAAPGEAAAPAVAGAEGEPAEASA